MVDDTAPQSDPTSGCPTMQDSCTDDELMDNFNNYMDYSDDECLIEFTDGVSTVSHDGSNSTCKLASQLTLLPLSLPSILKQQIDRMVEAWNTFRADGGAPTCAPCPVGPDTFIGRLTAPLISVMNTFGFGF